MFNYVDLIVFYFVLFVFLLQVLLGLISARPINPLSRTYLLIFHNTPILSLVRPLMISLLWEIFYISLISRAAMCGE